MKKFARKVAMAVALMIVTMLLTLSCTLHHESTKENDLNGIPTIEPIVDAIPPKLIYDTSQENVTSICIKHIKADPNLNHFTLFPKHELAKLCSGISVSFPEMRAGESTYFQIKYQTVGTYEKRQVGAYVTYRVEKTSSLLYDEYPEIEIYNTLYNGGRQFNCKTLTISYSLFYSDDETPVEQPNTSDFSRVLQ